MKILFRLLRWPRGQIIIFLGWLSGPRPPTHSAEVQQKLDAQTAHLKLYQFQQCPFCVRTRRSIRGLGLNIETRDARNDLRWHDELIEQGGKYQMPCLRIDKGGEKRPTVIYGIIYTGSGLTFHMRFELKRQM